MSETRYYAVDRIDGELVVLIDDSGAEVLASLEELPTPVEEGMVLRVPIDVDGRHDWERARIDHRETERRRREAEALLRELRRRDPGGDIEL
jgi:hypothetical protein